MSGADIKIEGGIFVADTTLDEGGEVILDELIDNNTKLFTLGKDDRFFEEIVFLWTKDDWLEVL